MHIMQSRRDFLTSASCAAAASIIDTGTALAGEGPPETTTIRIGKSPGICLAPGYIADDLLRAEGFTDVQGVPTAGGFNFAQMAGRGEIDLGISFAGSVVFHLDAGVPVTALAGVHSGCYELFAHEPVRTIGDLKGRRVAIQTLNTSGHLYMAIIVKHIGLDPHADIDWVVARDAMELGDAMDLFAKGKADAFLGFPPEPQELRARGIGRMILSTVIDKPWSQYVCCMLFGSTAFVRDHPIATKRAMRAILKAADMCAAEPKKAAQRLVEGGYAERYDYALQTLTEVPYDRWREFDAEDTMRFFALRLAEVGMISNSPNALIAEGTDWRFLNELKRELKA